MSKHAAPTEPRQRSGREHLAAAALAAVATSGLAEAAQVNRIALLMGLGVLQALLVLSWVFGTGLPGRIGGLLIGTGVAGAADAILYMRDRASLAPLLGLLGLAVPAMLLHQLTRGVVRVRVTESLSGVAMLTTAVACAATYLALYRAVDGTRLVSAALFAAGVGLVTGRLMDIVLPVPRFTADVPHGLLAVGTSIALGAAAGAAYAVSRATDQVQLGEGALLGAGTAGVAALVAVGVGYVVYGTGTAGGQPGQPARGRFGRAAVAFLRVGLPLAMAGPVAYLLGLWAVG